MNLRLIAGLVLAISLTACGGGGSSPLPQTTNPPPKQTQYAVNVTFQGGASLRSTNNRTTSFVTTFTRTLDVSTDPIVISAPPPKGSFFGSVGDVQDSGVATVNVSPMPSASPAVSYAVYGVDVSATAVPSPAAGVAQAHVDAQPSATPAAGTFTVNLTGSVQQSVTTNTYTVPRANLLCNSVALTSYPASDNVAGVAFESGVAVAVHDPGSADLSITGSWCTNDSTAFQTNETDPTLHCQYGCVMMSSANVKYWNLTTTQWSNAQTSVDLVTWQQQATQPNGNDLVLLKTADGKIVRIGVNSFSAGTPPSPPFGSSPASINFLYEEDGFSPLGF